MTSRDDVVTRRSEPFRGHQALYRDTGNPSWVWDAVFICVQGKFDFPDWIRGYLGDTAKRLSHAPATTSRDLGRALRSALGFERSKGSKHSLKAPNDLLRLESLAMEFAVHIFAGKKPSDARRDTANMPGLSRKIDDKTVQTKLKQFFKLTSSPHKNVEWREELLVWMLAHPGYEDVYPKLPKKLSVMRQYIELHPHVKGFNQMADGSLAPLVRT